MNPMDRLIASMSPDDTIAAVRLLQVMEECGQIGAEEAERWRRRIVGWERFNGAETGAEPSA